MTVADFPLNPRSASRSYEVTLRGSELSMRFYRPVPSETIDRITSADLSSNAALGRPRRWSARGEGEDATQFFGISCFDSYAQALANARVADVRPHLGRIARWNGIAEFTIDPHAGHTYANTFESGHWTAWGEASALLGRVSEVYPVPVEGSGSEAAAREERSREPVAYKVVDGESGNTVSFVTGLADSVAWLKRMVAERPEDREVLVLVGVAKDGSPRGSWLSDYFAEKGVG
jgi:hypothetical protein